MNDYLVVIDHVVRVIVAKQNEELVLLPFQFPYEFLFNRLQLLSTCFVVGIQRRSPRIQYIPRNGH